MLGLTGCRQRGLTESEASAHLDEVLSRLPGGWVGAHADRGHRLRTLRSGAWPAPQRQRRVQVLIVGAGVSGLAAARALAQRGVSDVALLDLEGEAGGNARGHTLGGMACPLGAHYLPVPGPNAPQIQALLQELGLARHEHGRWVYDERHLCHSPQERLYIDGAWHDGLLPPAEPGSTTQAQYRRFGERVAQLQRERPFVLPSVDQALSPSHRSLDAQTLAHWLLREGLTDERLRWYLDYCCRDDYGAGLDTVSAWAGIHYFASRHGFHAPGEGVAGGESEREPVLTWPEGNAWLTRRLAEPLREHLHLGRTVLQVQPGKHDVTVMAWDETTGTTEAWRADQVILAVPLFVAARLLDPLPEVLRQAASVARYAPWLVTNLHLGEPLLPRVGAPPAWDSVVYRGTTLGHVDAMHQSLRPHEGQTVLTVYQALPADQRAALLDPARPWTHWARHALTDLLALQPDLPDKLRRVDLMRYGHAMRIPVPGTRADAARQVLAQCALPGRVQLAHADLAGYSVFEEAYTAGWNAAGASRRTVCQRG